MSTAKKITKVEHGGTRPGAGRPKKDGTRKSYFLSNDVIRLSVLTAQKLGGKTKETDVVEMAVREFAAKHGVKAE